MTNIWNLVICDEKHLMAWVFRSIIIQDKLRHLWIKPVFKMGLLNCSSSLLLSGNWQGNHHATYWFNFYLNYEKHILSLIPTLWSMICKQLGYVEISWVLAFVFPTNDRKSPKISALFHWFERIIFRDARYLIFHIWIQTSGGFPSCLQAFKHANFLDAVGGTGHGFD